MDLQNIFGFLKKLRYLYVDPLIFYVNVQYIVAVPFSLNVCLLYFICYYIDCFGTEIFMSKIKSMNFPTFSCYLLACEQICLFSSAVRSEEKLLNSQPVIIYALFRRFLFYFASTVMIYFFVVINRQATDFFLDSSSEKPISITRNQEHRSKSRQNVNLCAHCFLSAAFLWHTSMHRVFVH